MDTPQLKATQLKAADKMKGSSPKYQEMTPPEILQDVYETHYKSKLTYDQYLQKVDEKFTPNITLDVIKGIGTGVVQGVLEAAQSVIPLAYGKYHAFDLGEKRVKQVEEVQKAIPKPETTA